VDIRDSVRAKDVYIIQTGLDNNCIMEMMIMAYACQTSSAQKIVGVIPYLPYSKQCKPSCICKNISLDGNQIIFFFFL